MSSRHLLIHRYTTTIPHAHWTFWDKLFTNTSKLYKQHIEYTHCFSAEHYECNLWCSSKADSSALDAAGCILQCPSCQAESVCWKSHQVLPVLHSSLLLTSCVLCNVSSELQIAILIYFSCLVIYNLQKVSVISLLIIHLSDNNCVCHRQVFYVSTS